VYPTQIGKNDILFDTRTRETNTTFQVDYKQASVDVNKFEESYYLRD